MTQGLAIANRIVKDVRYMLPSAWGINYVIIDHINNFVNCNYKKLIVTKCIALEKQFIGKLWKMLAAGDLFDFLIMMVILLKTFSSIRVTIP